jgi:ABC-type multidrug transport system permease subunit
MQLNLLENVYMNVFMQYYINIDKPLYIVVPPERVIIRRERDAGAYRLSAYYIAKITSELPLLLCAPLIFFSILYWMVGIGDATLYVIFVAVNLLYCLMVQVIAIIILFKKSLKIPKGQSEAVNRRTDNNMRHSQQYFSNGGQFYS